MKKVEQYIEKKSIKRRILDYIEITIASFIYAIGVSLFLDPNNLAPGGVTGIAIIINRLTGIETGTWIFIINIPILLLGTWKFGIRFILSTSYCTLLTSWFTNLLAPIGAVTDDLLLAALTGSALTAISLGIVFKAGATTGGTDIIVKLLRLKFQHLKTGVLFFLTDMIIVTTSGFVFQNLNSALYAGIVVIVSAMILDVVLYGRDGAKLLFIISDNSEIITDRILKELDVGVTHIEGNGAFSGKEKKVIMCVLKKPVSPQAEQIVKEEDPDAFMIITSATEIYGEGYKNIYSEKI